jgi:hypothetical protein
MLLTVPLSKVDRVTTEHCGRRTECDAYQIGLSASVLEFLAVRQSLVIEQSLPRPFCCCSWPLPRSGHGMLSQLSTKAF